MGETLRGREQALALGGLQAVFDANIIGIAISDPDGRIVAANDSYLATLGFSRADLAEGRVDWRTVTPPEYAEADAKALDEFARRGVSPPFEKAYLHPDGRRVPVVLASARIPETGGMATFVLDISGQKEAEEALRRSEERYRELFDAAAAATFVIDRETLRILDANRMANALYGYTRDELLRLTAADLSAEPEASARFIRSVMARPGSDPQVGERLHRRKDGSVFPVEFTARVLEREGRQVVLVGTRDITHRRAAEEAIRQRALILNAAPFGLTVHASDGRMLYANPRAAAMHGYGVEEFAALPPASYMSAGGIAELPGGAHAPWGRGIATYEATHVRKDASPLAVEVTVVPTTWDGAEAVLAITLDVTQRRQAQAAVDQAQRAEMVGRLAGGVAHDFNNLLTAVGGHAEFILETLALDDPRRPDVTSILDATARAADLTRQLLAIGRREFLNPSICVPGDLVERLRPMLRSLVPADVYLVLRLDPTRTRVRVDRDRLDSALINLVLNARDAMTGSGTLTVATEAVRLEAGDNRLRDAAAPGDYMRVSVGDTGQGITKDLLPHIFEPFFTTKALGRGSGLGLPSVEGFLAQSGGWVAVDTAPGVGSVFSLYLAAVPEPAVEEAPSPGPGVSAGGGETVLLVDDEVAVRAITARLLRQLGYRVIEAADGDEAVDISRRTRLDALVSDVVLPGLSGPDLAARCQAVQPGLPVLLMSGYARESLLDEGRSIAGSSFLAKPFTLEVLGQRLRDLLAAHPVESSGPDTG